MTDALIIGGGPAGLMAADVISAAGYDVVVADQMPTVGRKFLMAGKSGLNLTKAEPKTQFHQAYGAAKDALSPALSAFGPDQVCDWAEGLGQTVFTGTTKRVFPTVMKASPLLRAWLARLNAQGVQIKTRWRWTGWDDGACFDTPDGPATIKATTTVLALGGGSWARLGSDGAWAQTLPDATNPFKPANMGFEVTWSPHMAPHFGAAVKGCALSAGDMVSRGEFVVSAKGIEGGGVYAVSAAVRDGARLIVDLLPDMSLDEVRARMSSGKAKQSTANMLRKTLKLDPVKRALFNEFGRNAQDMAATLKGLAFPYLSPRPMDEAISTAGGVRFDVLTPDLELMSNRGVFCAGEMLDWEAPTGGYLITGCLATGRHAGLAAVRRLQIS
ncbi:TIGR03862 family flavoprotein [Pseudooctadecabacter jejudonensis]|uniref:Putative glutamate synthase subunit beta n=1 Tax=Pseudooctadecabacter jejudonensis TaxID=1391910 RepID=A0A1Y5SBE8_9RHOB|nr:TIGR03862 family flavoprotein [Pseudooctadecabacter jejudonensis]SLN35303.1 putative glutamate synthase subunit beta [Pseudooctadecabacter jejudonensis]